MMDPAQGDYGQRKRRKLTADERAQKRQLASEVAERRAERAYRKEKMLKAKEAKKDGGVASAATMEVLAALAQLRRDRAHAKRMQDPVYAEKYKRRELMRRFKNGGRILGYDKKKKGPLGELLHFVGVPSGGVPLTMRGSAREYEDLVKQIRNKRRADYAKRRGITVSQIRKPMTDVEKKAKRRAAYAKKRGITVNQIRKPRAETGPVTYRMDDMFVMNPGMEVYGPPKRRPKVPKQTLAKDTDAEVSQALADLAEIVPIDASIVAAMNQMPAAARRKRAPKRAPVRAADMPRPTRARRAPNRYQ